MNQSNQSSPGVPNADLIRAALDGKVVQWRIAAPNALWRDYDCDVLDTVVCLAARRVDPVYEFRLKPESVASWHAVYTNGYVDQGYATKAEVDVHSGVAKVLRLELDPDTLEVLSARTEAP